MAKSYELLRETLSPERRSANEARAVTLLQLEELREAIALAESQVQSRRNDLVSTTSLVDAFLCVLNETIAKHGGSLHLVATFPAGQTEIGNLSSLAAPPQG